jgi:hypothetical protein
MFRSPSPELHVSVDYKMDAMTRGCDVFDAHRSLSRRAIGRHHLTMSRGKARIGERSSVAAIDLNRHKRFR